MLNVFKWIKNRLFMSKIQYIGKRTIWTNNVNDNTTTVKPNVPYTDNKNRYADAKKNNEFVAHLLNQYFEKIGIVSIAEDYDKPLKWLFAYFTEQFSTYNDEDLNMLCSDYMRFIKYKYDGVSIVCMFDNLRGTLVKMKMDIVETKDKSRIFIKLGGTKCAKV